MVDGHYLESGAFDKTVNIWNTETGKLLNTLVGHKRPVIGVGITNDKKKVISASFGNVIKIWDVASGRELKEIMIEKESGWKEGFDLISFVLSPNTRFIIGGLQGDLKEGGLLKIWRVADGNVVQTLPIKQDFPGYYEELNDITISRDGEFIIAASRERMVKVWIDFLYYLDRIGLYQ